MKKFSVLLGIASLLGCVGPETATGPRVQAPNGMSYSAEQLGAGRYYLSIFDTRKGVARVQDSKQAMEIYAHRWAAEKFPKGYELEQPGGWKIPPPVVINPSIHFIVTEKR